MQFKQSEYEFAKNLLQLFKQRSKESPNINHNFESLITSSYLKQDYLEIIDRVGLTRKDTTNNLAELIRFAKETAKYGVKVHYLEDINKHLQERLRNYFLDLNKYLKEMYDTLTSIWNCFKKIKSRTVSVQNQKQNANLELKFYLTRLKQFKQDVENNKYSIIKTNNLINAENTANRVQEIKLKVLSIYHSFSSQNPIIVKKKELRDSQLDTVLDQIQKKVNDKIKSSTKEFYINCFINVLQCRKIQDLKLIQKDIQYATKKNEELQLKRALKLYIQDQIQREKQSLISVKSNQTTSYFTPLSSNQNVLNQEISQTEKTKQNKQDSFTQIQQLKNQITHLKELVKEKSKNQIKYQDQVNKLKQQLQNQMKFAILDRSNLSHLDEVDQLITYQCLEDITTQSLETNLENQLLNSRFIQESVIQEYSCATSSNKVDMLIKRIMELDKLEVKMNEQIKELTAQNNQLVIQISKYQTQVTLYKNRLEQEKQEKEGYKIKIQELFHHLRQFEEYHEFFNSKIEIQIQNFMNQQQSYLQRIQQLKIENNELENKIYQLVHLNNKLEYKIEQLQQAIDNLHIDISQLQEELNVKINELQSIEIEKRKLHLSLQNQREQLQTINHRNKVLNELIQKLGVSEINQSQTNNQWRNILVYHK